MKTEIDFCGGHFFFLQQMGSVETLMMPTGKMGMEIEMENLLFVSTICNTVKINMVQNEKSNDPHVHTSSWAKRNKKSNILSQFLQCSNGSSVNPALLHQRCMLPVST